MKLLSVIIPFYNTKETLFRKCLSTLICKNIACVEIVIVDDGSSVASFDSLTNIVNDFNADIQIYRKQNGGQNSARDFGLRRASGRYVFFVDSDDYVNTENFDRVIEILASEEPVILAFNYDVVDGAGKVLTRHNRWTGNYAPMDLKRGILYSYSLWTQIYDKKTLLNLDEPLVQGLKIGEDLASATRILLSVGSASTIGLSVYRYVKGHPSVLSNPEQDTLQDILQAFDRIMDLPRETLGRFHDEIEWLAILHVLFWGGKRIIQNDDHYLSLKMNLFQWMARAFPDWKNNIYLQNSELSRKIVFRLIIDGKWKVYDCMCKLKRVMKRLIKRGVK